MWVILWLVQRHSVFLLWYSHGGTPTYVEPSWHLSFQAFREFSGCEGEVELLCCLEHCCEGLWRLFSVCQGRPDRHRVVRKVWMSFGFVIPSLLIQFIIASIAKVHVGRLLDQSVYDFSHVSSVA